MSENFEIFGWAHWVSFIGYYDSIIVEINIAFSYCDGEISHNKFILLTQTGQGLLTFNGMSLLSPRFWNAWIKQSKSSISVVPQSYQKIIQLFLRLTVLTVRIPVHVWCVETDNGHLVYGLYWLNLWTFNPSVSNHSCMEKKIHLP